MLESLAFLDLPCQDFLYLDDGDLGNIGPMTTIGDRIRAARKAAGLTQDQLAEDLGRSKGAISQWENEQGQPDLYLVAAMCERLKVSADYLIRGIDASFVDAKTLAMASKLTTLSTVQFDGLSKLFGPAVPDERVAQFLPPAPKKNHKK